MAWAKFTSAGKETGAWAKETLSLHFHFLKQKFKQRSSTFCPYTFTGLDKAMDINFI